MTKRKEMILIVDDHPLVREGMEQMLLSEGFEVKTAANGKEALTIAGKGASPDLVVSDIRMPEMDGFTLLSELRKICPGIHVLLLAGAPLKAEVEKAREGKAVGYLPKATPWRKLVELIRRAQQPKCPFLSEDMPAEETGPLTEREMAVLRYLNLGKTRDEIAIILGIGGETVKSHVKSIMAKLDAPSATGAVGRAYELGILRA